MPVKTDVYPEYATLRAWRRCAASRPDNAYRRRLYPGLTNERSPSSVSKRWEPTHVLEEGGRPLQPIPERVERLRDSDGEDRPQARLRELGHRQEKVYPAELVDGWDIGFPR